MCLTVCEEHQDSSQWTAIISLLSRWLMVIGKSRVYVDHLRQLCGGKYYFRKRRNGKQPPCGEKAASLSSSSALVFMFDSSRCYSLLCCITLTSVCAMTHSSCFSHNRLRLL
uniref:Uncharacterized protein n=2 Tax=Nothobranchius kadleci TaxID=1051664 RepID=A0A1A8BFI0_NOTKA